VSFAIRNVYYSVIVWYWYVIVIAIYEVDFIKVVHSRYLSFGKSCGMIYLFLRSFLISEILIYPIILVVWFSRKRGVKRMTEKQDDVSIKYEKDTTNFTYTRPTVLPNSNTACNDRSYRMIKWCRAAFWWSSRLKSNYFVRIARKTYHQLLR